VIMFCSLQTFADQLVERFVSSGIMLREYDRVKLHITVMNSLMRKDPSDAISNRTSTRSGTADRESFDATLLMQVFLVFTAIELTGCTIVTLVFINLCHITSMLCHI